MSDRHRSEYTIGHVPGTLDIVALRSYVAIGDCGGYHRAAQRLHLSQSTVSAHVRKLEVTVGSPLLEPQGRGMRFTPDGELLLAHARRLLQSHDEILETFSARHPATVVIGATDHAADHLLPRVTRAIAAELPGVDLRYRLDKGGQLIEGLERGTVDIALLFGGGPGSTLAGDLPLRWYAAPGYPVPPADEPLPLVVIDEPCTIRRKAIATLTTAGRPHRIVGEAGYLAGVLNAARAGVGIALVATPGGAPEGLVECAGLPPAAGEPLYVRASPRTRLPQLVSIVTETVRAAL
jgi:DNA-binding transcriptional LysR family regulator